MVNETCQAQSLIRGRRSSEGKSAIVGLIGFADRLKSLSQSVCFDDPYADWWLIKVGEAIAASRAQLQQVACCNQCTHLVLSCLHPNRPVIFCGCFLAERKAEIFGCLFLDNQHRVIDTAELFQGTIDGASVYPRVVQQALSLNTAAVITLPGRSKITVFRCIRMSPVVFGMCCSWRFTLSARARTPAIDCHSRSIGCPKMGIRWRQRR